MPQSQPLRIVSLLPSGTDIIAALGLEGQLVGVSHACDHPIAQGKPVLTSLRLEATVADPAAIDRVVSEASQAGESLYALDPFQLKALRPDVVISQDLCGVCAVDGREIARAVPGMARLVMLSANSLEGLYADLQRVGEATGTVCWSQEAADELRSRLAVVERQVAGLARPRVLALEWSDPPYLGGHWVPELITLAGGENVLAEPRVESRRASWEAIAEADPDVIVFMPCGYTLPEAVAEAQRTLDEPEVRALRAVREGRVWATHATALFSRLTPKAAVAAETLAAILHPEALPEPDPRWAVRVY